MLPVLITIWTRSFATSKNKRKRAVSNSYRLPLSILLERDETAWLEVMSQLAAEGRYSEMEYAKLSEYLSDMSKTEEPRKTRKTRK